MIQDCAFPVLFLHLNQSSNILRWFKLVWQNNPSILTSFCIRQTHHLPQVSPLSPPSSFYFLPLNTAQLPPITFLCSLVLFPFPYSSLSLSLLYFSNLHFCFKRPLSNFFFGEVVSHSFKGPKNWKCWGHVLHKPLRQLAFCNFGFGSPSPCCNSFLSLCNTSAQTVDKDKSSV